MNILVTGANVGSAVVEELSARECTIRLALRNLEECTALRGEKLKFIAVMVALYSSVRFGYAAETTTTLEELLGRPAISLEQYVIC